jgi:hypothetical protein
MAVLFGFVLNKNPHRSRWGLASVVETQTKNNDLPMQMLFDFVPVNIRQTEQ